jgi:hypothetical protein
MYILFYDYKQLTECISEIERIEAGVNSKKKEWLTKRKEKEEVPTTLYSYFVKNNVNYNKKYVSCLSPLCESLSLEISWDF